jgi:gluconokinase
MGVAGAGKTLIGAAFARAMGITFVDGDDFHSPENVKKMASGKALTDQDRADWLRALAARLAEAEQEGKGLVVACSALKRKYRDVLRSGAPDVRFIFLEGPSALIASRLKDRHGHYMPVSLLKSQFMALEPPTPVEHAWTYDVSEKPDDIVAKLVSRARE